MDRILIVGGGSELQPQLRRVAADIETIVLCGSGPASGALGSCCPTSAGSTV